MGLKLVAFGVRGLRALSLVVDVVKNPAAALNTA